MPLSINKTLRIHSSVSCTFFAPSDPCGVHGLRREHIRSTWNWRGAGPRQDVVLVNTGDGGNKALPMSGYALARVLLLFSFKHDGETVPVALVWWYSLAGEDGCRDELTGMWLVEREYRDDTVPHLAVVHVDTILRAAHLLPFFGSNRVPRDLSHNESLDSYHLFYVNRFADHHSFELL
jgi:hypothetical protein